MFLQAVGRRLWGRYIRGTANTVVALDAIARDRVLNAGFSEKRVVVLPGGVDLNACRPGLTSGVILRHGVKGRILLYVGQITDLSLIHI